MKYKINLVKKNNKYINLLFYIIYIMTLYNKGFDLNLINILKKFKQKSPQNYEGFYLVAATGIEPVTSRV